MADPYREAYLSIIAAEECVDHRRWPYATDLDRMVRDRLAESVARLLVDAVPVACGPHPQWDGWTRHHLEVPVLLDHPPRDGYATPVRVAYDGGR